MKIFSATLSMVMAAAASKVVVGCGDCNSQCLGNLKWGGEYSGCSKTFEVSEDLTQGISYSFLTFDLVPLSGDDNLLPRMYSVPGSKKLHFVQLCQANPNDEKMTCLSSEGAENAIYTATSWDEDCQVQDISVSGQVVRLDKANKLEAWSASEEYRLTSLENPITHCGPANKDNFFWLGEIQPNGDKTTVTCVAGCDNSSSPHESSSSKNALRVKSE